MHQALGTFGFMLTLGVGEAVTARSAVAAPSALTSTPKTSKAAKGAGKARRAAAHAATRARTESTARADRHVGRSHDRRYEARHGVRHETRHTRRRGRHTAERLAYAAPQPSADLVSVPVIALPDLALTAAPPSAPRGGSTLTLITRSAASLLDGLLTRARSQLGTRYVYGGANPDIALDCSSFARYVMEALNVRLPRTANQQAQVGIPVPRDPSALRPGDLLTFGSGRHTSHVGIYLGQGRFIHASVKSGQVIETTIERNRSLFRRWQGARRLLAGVPDSVASGVDATSGG